MANINKIDRIYGAYALAAYGYTWVRKMCQLWDAKIERRTQANGNVVVNPMLMGEKLFVFTCSVVAAPVLTPMFIIKDMDYLDLYMKGLKAEEYGVPYKPPSSIVEYIWK